MFWDDYLWKLYMTVSLWSYSMYQNLPGSYENEDTDRDIYQLIESRGFKYESHFVQTKDGYILQLVRLINPFINGTKRRRLKPILLQHGFQCTGSLWLIAANGTLDRYGNYIEYIVDSEDRPIVINGTKEEANSLGFVLASKNFDVWLANYRGSYSII
ncbi:Alpha/beta-hydrolase lipase region, variant 2 [Dermatophagoides farinae]|uniref:Alpha/beta-hydrolase lipase region, variant 2 n=1 Tax=Dermatophagoides farinae TaxID=6954 RepID=A0A922IC23_DERFA|nr:Alpha/beta-hydrolase lipase region, variant 2 [Dermatophagoides farinae]